MPRILIPFLALLLLLQGPAHAVESYQTPAEIRQAVRQFIQQQYQPPASAHIEVGRLDSRLRLKRCAQPLQAFFPHVSRKNKVTVGVRCDSPKHWTIYLTANIVQKGEVLVAKVPIRRGQPIRVEDFELREYDLNRLTYGYFTDINDVLGKSLKRHLNPGAVLTPAAIAVNKVVKRGEQVTIIAETAGIVVYAKGQALEAGGIGDIIRVKNLKSKKEIEARITGPGHVKVDL